MVEPIKKAGEWLQELGDSTISQFRLRAIQRDAEVALKRVHAPSDAAAIYAVLGICAFALGQFERAAEAYQRGHALDRHNGALLTGVGVTHLAAGRLEQAIDFLLRAYEAEKDGSRLARVTALANLAEAFWYIGEQDGAVETIREAIRLADHSNFDEVVVLANQLAELGDITGASEYLAKALAAHRGTPVAVEELPATLTATERDFLSRRHGIARLLGKLQVLPSAPTRFRSAAPVDGHRLGGGTEVLEETRAIRNRANALILEGPNELRPA